MDNLNFPKLEFEHLLNLGLTEDLGGAKENFIGDITSLACLSPSHNNTAKIIAKQNGIICGLLSIQLIFEKIAVPHTIKLHCSDGDFVTQGQLIATIESNTQSLLAYERTLLNFIQNLSGIATITHSFTDIVKNTSIKILDTRKILPGYRKLHKYAVFIGGGTNHRFGLYDQILLKENHLAALDNNINLAIQKSLDYTQGKVKIEIEIQNQAQLEMIKNTLVNQIMLDNMSLSQMHIAITWIRQHLPQTAIEASGNMSLERIQQIKHLDLDYISVGSLTHSPSAFDLSMLIVP